jgi:hypothetical protein
MWWVKSVQLYLVWLKMRPLTWHFWSVKSVPISRRIEAIKYVVASTFRYVGSEEYAALWCKMGIGVIKDVASNLRFVGSVNVLLSDKNWCD